jgi:predicted phage terminase large subunit-like protein
MIKSISDTQLLPSEEVEIAQYKCINSLLYHTRFFFRKTKNRKFMVNKHHEIICNALERVLRGELKRLIINIAPRYGKTELAVKNFISHGLALNPAAKFIHLSYSDMLALDNSEEVKDLIEEPAYRQLFPNVRFKAGSASKKKWYTTAGGGVYATSAAGQVTGFGAGNVDEKDEERARLLQLQEDEELADQVKELIDDIDGVHLSPIEKKYKFGGAIIIDDPIKPDDADSDLRRERVNNRFDSTIRNRVNSRNTPIVVIMQRLHERDLSGYLMDVEPGEWEVISLPVIDEQGDALWPAKHTIAELRRLEATNELVFSRQYMQNPKPKEGLEFAKEDLLFYDPEKIDVERRAEFKFYIIDPADEGGDDLAGVPAYLIGNRIYVPEVIYNGHGTDINTPLCAEDIISRKINHAHFEGNGGWAQFGKDVRKRVQKKLNSCDIRIIFNSTNKHVRILAQSGFIRKNFYFNKNYTQYPQYRKFMEILTSYRKIARQSKHDDAPDALAGIARFFRNRFAHLWETEDDEYDD